MFKLAESRGSSRGLYCGSDGLFLGPSPLIELHDGVYRVRCRDEVATFVAAAYDQPPDVEGLLPRLSLIAADLQRGDLGRAMISAVLLGLGDLSDDDVLRLARAEALLKYNFNPAEPRDQRGRWARGEAAGMIAPVRAERPPGRRPPRAARAWQTQPNAEFRNRLAIAEGNADKPNFGYDEVRRSNGALGRYQMTPAALQAAGMIVAAGNWTGKYGVHSRAEFLADPEAQENALTDFLDDTERQLRANGSVQFIGADIDGLVSRFTVSRAGLIAAGHRWGARATHDYLSRIANNGFTSRGLDLSPAERAIETRLRTFADVPYE